MLLVVLIFVAGGCGCLLRYGLGGWVQGLSGGSFPVGTLVVNLLGCAAVGFLAAALTGPVLVREEYRQAVLVGLLGGFTTFSTYCYETIALAGGGQMLTAALNLVLSNALGLAGAWAGARAAGAIYGT